MHGLCARPALFLSSGLVTQNAAVRALMTVVSMGYYGVFTQKTLSSPDLQLYPQDPLGVAMTLCSSFTALPLLTSGLTGLNDEGYAAEWGWPLALLLFGFRFLVCVDSGNKLAANLRGLQDLFWPLVLLAVIPSLCFGFGSGLSILGAMQTLMRLVGFGVPQDPLAEALIVSGAVAGGMGAAALSLNIIGKMTKVLVGQGGADAPRDKALLAAFVMAPLGVLGPLTGAFSGGGAFVVKLIAGVGAFSYGIMGNAFGSVGVFRGALQRCGSSVESALESV